MRPGADPEPRRSSTFVVESTQSSPRSSRGIGIDGDCTQPWEEPCRDAREGGMCRWEIGPTHRMVDRLRPKTDGRSARIDRWRAPLAMGNNLHDDSGVAPTRVGKKKVEYGEEERSGSGGVKGEVVQAWGRWSKCNHYPLDNPRRGNAPFSSTLPRTTQICSRAARADGRSLRR